MMRKKTCFFADCEDPETIFNEIIEYIQERIKEGDTYKQYEDNQKYYKASTKTAKMTFIKIKEYVKQEDSDSEEEEEEEKDKRDLTEETQIQVKLLYVEDNKYCVEF